VTVNGINLGIGASHDWALPVTIIFDTQAGYNAQRPVPAEDRNYNGVIRNDPQNPDLVVMDISPE
jgi:hypothetical protein